jgi:hypothetical protein
MHRKPPAHRLSPARGCPAYPCSIVPLTDMVSHLRYVNLNAKLSREANLCDLCFAKNDNGNQAARNGCPDVSAYGQNRDKRASLIGDPAFFSFFSMRLRTKSSKSVWDLLRVDQRRGDLPKLSRLMYRNWILQENFDKREKRSTDNLPA